MQMQAGLWDRTSSDRWISLAVCLQVLLVGMKNMLIQAFEELYEVNDILNIILFVAVGVAYLLAYVSLGPRMVFFSPMSLGLVAFLVISFAASAILHPHGLVRYGELLTYVLPFGFLTAFMLTKLTTLKWIAYYMERFAYVIIGTSLICVVGILSAGHTTTSDWSTYSMSLSNVIMVGVIWLLYRYFERRRIVALVGAFWGIVAILFCGSRNPLLAIIAYLIAKTAIKMISKRTPNRERWLYVIWVALMILFFLFFEQIIQMVNYLFDILGIYSRSVRLLENDLFFDSGRSSIHRSLIAALNQRPLIGLGIGGDMEIINWAAHNFYLSVLSTYGYPIGILLLIILGVMLVMAFRRCQGISREVLIIYTCLFLPRSFTGNDIWRSDIPWWLIGIIMVILTYQRREKALSGDQPEKEADPISVRGA